MQDSRLFTNSSIRWFVSTPYHKIITLSIYLLVFALVLCAASKDAKAAPNERALAHSKAVAGGPWGWSNNAQAWAVRTGVLKPAVVGMGSQQPLTRTQFIAALAKVEALSLKQRRVSSTSRQKRTLLRGITSNTYSAPARPGAPAGSLAARALALRWLTPIKGTFAGSQPITSNEAALATAGVLGFRSDVQQLAVSLKNEVPGTSKSVTYLAAQAIVRTLGLRYNVRDPYDAYELGPDEQMNVAHASYMLKAAIDTQSSWKLDAAHKLATAFDLPDLTPNQALILSTGVNLLGQPYVWAGETEGEQVEGHGGFDCSGFAIRVTNSLNLPVEVLAPMKERTTYTQSAIAANERVSMTNLQPGDVMFFGDSGPNSSPSSIYHAGIYMGNNWFIHSSGGNAGVAIDNLDSWWNSQFAWGRRLLLQ